MTVPDGEPLAEGARWDDWRRELIAVLGGKKTLDEAVGDKLRSHSPVQRPRPKVPVGVEVDNNASARFTVVDLSGPDRLGLLYDVTRALAEEGLTIRLAKIVTMIHRVADAFYVETLDGRKLTAPGDVARLQRRLAQIAAGD